MDFKGTRGKWKHKKGKRTKFEYDNFILDKYGNHILKWSNTGNGSHKLTIKKSHANGLLISKAPEMLELINEFYLMCIQKTFPTEHELEYMAEKAEKLIKEATEL